MAPNYISRRLVVALGIIGSYLQVVSITAVGGGRIAVGLLPDVLAVPLARMERYGMLILIALLIVLPMLGRDFGVDLSIISRFITIASSAVINLIISRP